MNISFSEAASELEKICENVDNATELDTPLRDTFDEKIKAIQDSIDRRISYRIYATSQMNLAHEMIESWTKRKRKFERVVEWVNKDTLCVMKCYPGIPFTGSLGSFAIRKSPKRLAITSERDLPICYIRQEFSYDKEGIKRDLIDGKEVPGASLVQEEHVRFITK